ncbi:sulfatase [Candidatus Poribacteria bacterium]|nr:sulfatase [Candidatus Poribacteria bacterium]
MARSPNFIFVFSDQHRYCDMGCAGNPDVITPNMNRLAREGTHFTHTISNVPLCVPARGCIMTGKHPLSHKAVSNDLPLPLSETGIAQVFKGAGYQTGYIGKWHLGGMPRDKFITPEMRFGFDYWAGWNCHHNYFNAHYHDSDGSCIPIVGYEPDFQTDLAIQYCKAHADEPFCLYLSWGPPHNPYEQVPEQYRAMVNPEAITLRPNAEGANRTAIANYYAHITALDANLGRLMGALDDLGIADDTILVYTSDHGDMLGSHGEVRKERPWEESIRVPFLIRWPGKIPAGVSRDTLLSIVDFVPTFLSLCGLPIPEGIQGVDLSRVALNPDLIGTVLGNVIDEPESVLLEIPLPGGEGFGGGVREWRGVRTRRYTYARFQDGEAWVLYDNVADPYQLRNLIDAPDYRAVRNELEAELLVWLNRIEDRFLPGLEHIRELGLAELWNISEQKFGGKKPRWA